jgi:hypothetical protein
VAPCARKTGISGSSVPGVFVFEERVRGLDLGRCFDRHEVLLKRLFRPLPLDQIERTLDAFVREAVDSRHRARIDHFVDDRTIHAMPRPQRHRDDVLTAPSDSRRDYRLMRC